MIQIQVNINRKIKSCAYKSIYLKDRIWYDCYSKVIEFLNMPLFMLAQTKS